MTPGSQTKVTSEDHDRFYTAAVAGLRALDRRERSPRRFGPDADARWTTFRGALTDADRIDLLLRDAAVTWGVAFSPADAFGMFGLAPDEPFGPDWQPLASSVARRHLASAPSSETPAEIGRMLGVADLPVDLPPLTPSTRIAVAGGAALVRVAREFAARGDLSWSDQVLAVATAPAHRQLAGLLAVFTNGISRTRVTRPADDLRATLKASGFAQLDVAVVSSDAEGPCATFARRAVGVA